MNSFSTRIADHRHARLVKDITDCGFYPELVSDAVDRAVGEEMVEDYFIYQEATFAHDNVGRHSSVLVLTPSRLIVCHTDEDAATGSGMAINSTSAVALTRMASVVLTRTMAKPETYSADEPGIVETWLTISWEGLRRVELETAACGDPMCEADHGYSGLSNFEDVIIRLSAAANGQETVERLVDFAYRLQQRVS